MPSTPHRKRLKRYHQPGELHELTFSCYKRLPILTNDAWRKQLSQSIDEAAASWRIQLVAFVYMPEHVHLLVLPHGTKEDISGFLADLKVGMSQAVKADLEARPNRLLPRLTVRERPGKIVFRYWQEGGGYDRNLHSRAAIFHAIDYIHMNPVRRGLCNQARAGGGRAIATTPAMGTPSTPTGQTSSHSLPNTCWPSMAKSARDIAFDSQTREVTLAVP